MVIPLVITVGAGATHLLSILKKAKPLFRIPVLLIFIALYIFNFAYYTDAYHVHGKMADARDFMYGYKQVVEKVVPVQDKYKKIVFVQSYDQPYIYFLFYGSQMGKDIYKPSNFQNNTSFVDNIGGDVGQLSELGNIEFRDINWNYDKTQEDTLLIAREHNFPLEETDVSSDYIIDRVYYPNGLTAFVMVEVNREP